ncbi:MAG: hypothetical protein ACXIUD_04470 [Mongoliitalea sp.]
MLFRIPNSYQVALFSSQGKLDDLVTVDFGSAGISEAERNNLSIDQTIELQMDEKIVLEIFSFYPVKSGYYLSYARGLKESMEVLLDKNFKMVKHLKNIQNDIDQMPVNVVPWFATDEAIGFYMHASDFRNDYRKIFSDDKLPSRDSNLYRFVHEFGPRLGEDTFILVLCKMKTLD